MRKFAIAVAACALVAAAVGTTSAAAPASYDTQVTIITGNKSPGGFILAGVLESEKKKCRAGRDMELFYKVENAKHRATVIPVDDTSSSDHGAWAFQVEQKTLDLKIKAFPKTLANGDLCKAETTPVIF
jgi:hypothetical protein